MRTNQQFAFLIGLIVFTSCELNAAQIRAAGSVRLPSLTASDFEQEPDIPGEAFDRSIVSIADSGAADGASYAYSASSDIGLGELKAFGQLSNPTGDELSDIELGLVTANARIEDTITIESDSGEDYDVTFEFHIDGSTDFSGGEGFVGASISTGALSAENEFFNTRVSQAIDETLTVTRTYNGTVDQTVTLQLFLMLNVAAAGGSLLADLGNTATLSIILPHGAVVTNSESGTFLEVITPVPLPGLLPLLLGVSGWLLTKRTGRAASDTV